MFQPTKVKSSSRNPPPSLFLHPSPAASHASLPGNIGGPPSSHQQASSQQPSAGLLGQRRGSLLGARDQASLRSSLDPLRPPTSSAGQAFGLNRPLQIPRGESGRTDRTDALWAEMQATLEEVELSASGGTRVFGPDHDRKLAELRAAQIALAQAWARSEADEAIETRRGSAADARNLKATTSVETGPDGFRTDGGTSGADGGPRSTAGTGSARPASSDAGAGRAERLGGRLEEETEADILLGRKRREANDRYFQRMNQGVLDVVAKLEEVAMAMRAVEQESRDMWGDESLSESVKS